MPSTHRESAYEKAKILWEQKGGGSLPEEIFTDLVALSDVGTIDHEEQENQFIKQFSTWLPTSTTHCPPQEETYYEQLTSAKSWLTQIQILNEITKQTTVHFKLESALIHLLLGKGIQIIQASANTLGQLQSPLTPSILALIKITLLEKQTISESCENALIQIGKPAVPFLLKALHQKPAVYNKIVNALVKIGSPAVPELVAAFTPEPASFAGSIISILGNIRPPDAQAIAKLVDILEQGPPSIREQATGQISHIGSPTVVSLHRLLNHPRVEVREAAVKAMKSITKSLYDQGDSFSQCLSQEDYHTTISLLAEMLFEENPKTISGVVEIFKAMKEDAVPILPRIEQALLQENEDNKRLYLFSILETMGAESVPLLGRLLRHTNPAYRKEAASALHHTKANISDSLPSLMELLKNKHEEEGILRNAIGATQKIGKLATPAIPLLIELLDHIADISHDAARALGDIADENQEAANALEWMYSPTENSPYLEALIKLGAAENMVRLLKKYEGHQAFHSILVGFVRMQKSPVAALPTLLKYMEASIHNETGYQASFVRIFGNMGPRADDAIPLLIRAYINYAPPKKVFISMTGEIIKPDDLRDLILETLLKIEAERPERIVQRLLHELAPEWPDIKQDVANRLVNVMNWPTQWYTVRMTPQLQDIAYRMGTHLLNHGSLQNFSSEKKTDFAPEQKKVYEELLYIGLTSEEAEQLIDPILQRRPHPGTMLKDWPGGLAQQLHGSVVFTHPGNSRHYLVTDYLGEGWMGAVYRAIVVEEPRSWVAIRIPHIRTMQQHDQEKAKDAFKREALALQGLRHPNLISLETFGETKNGTPYLVMEYVEGRSLVNQNCEGWDIERRWKCFSQIVNGLTYLHSLGRVHGTLNPRHILLDQAGTCKIIGFEAAITDLTINQSLRLRHSFALNAPPEFSSNTTPTVVAGIKGIPGYIAPENSQGTQPSRASDIFSLGCLQHFLMTGQTYPWSGSILMGNTPLQNATRQANEADPSIDWNNNPREKFLQGLFLQMVRYNPEQRPTIHEIQNQLESHSSGVLSKETIPAYFLSLTLENLRCFGPEQTLDLSDDQGRPARWTVILGDNGIGKTTLLQWLVAMEPVAKGTTDVGPKIASESWKHGDSIWSLHAHSQAISGRCNVLLSVQNQLYPDTTDSSQISLGVGIELLKRSGTTPKKVISSSFPVTRAFPRLVCHGYGAGRKMSGQRLQGDTAPDPSASLFADNIGLENPEEWLLQTDYAASKARINTHEQQRVQARYDQVKAILLDLLPEIEDLKVAGLDESPPVPRVEFKTPYGWVQLRELSLGYRTLIAWMVDLAQRLFATYPDSPEPLAEPAVVLVDEIDLHLHPRWQRSIMHKLSECFPNTQFIVTAHSPLIAQAHPGANLVVLRRVDNHVEIDNQPQTVRGWRVDQILTSDLFGLDSSRSLDTQELLTERTRILSQPELSEANKQRLRDIANQIGDLPTAETTQDIEAMHIIRRAAAILQAKEAGS